MVDGVAQRRIGSAGETRFDALDGWRGLCALMVVFLHAPIAGPIGQSGFVRHSFLFVDFFFVLSGFVIAHAWGERLWTEGNWRAFLKARFWRVYPLHLVMLTAFAVFEAIRIRQGPTGVVGHAETPYSFVHNVLLTHSLGFVQNLGWNYPSWSISAEFVSYVLFAALLLWMPRRMGTILAIAVLGGLLFLLVRLGHIEAHVDYGWLRCLAGFSLGALLRLRVWNALRCDVRSDLASQWTLVEIGTVAYVIAFVALFGTSPISVAAPFVFAVAIFVFAHEGGALSRLLKTRPAAILGLLSYSIYMTHAFVIARVTNVGTLLERRLGWDIFVGPAPDSRLLADSLGRELLALGLIVGGTLVLSAVTWRLVEKPGQAWGRSLARRETQRAAKARIGKARRI